MPPAGADPNAAVASPYSIGSSGGGDMMAFLLRSLMKDRARSLAQTPGEALGGPQLGMATGAPAMPPARMMAPHGAQMQPPPSPHGKAGFAALTRRGGKNKPPGHPGTSMPKHEGPGVRGIR